MPALNQLDLPATGITWKEARTWCQWAGMHLPSEALWEYAARGGVDGARWPWGDGAAWDPAKANVAGSGPAAVGTSGPANGFGLYDVIGNAAEWCSDAHAPEAPQRDPAGEARPRRVVRGGSWRSTAATARLSARAAVVEDDVEAAGDVGFRAIVMFP